MKNDSIKYTDHYETIVALVTYLAVCNRRSKRFNKTIDNSNIDGLAKYLRLEFEEVKTVLESYNHLFRKSLEEYENGYRYSLLLRYAHRPYDKLGNEDVSDPLTNDELFSLLSFISNKVKMEQEEEGQRINNKNQQRTMFIAALSAIVAAAAAVISALVR